MEELLKTNWVVLKRIVGTISNPKARALLIDMPNWGSEVFNPSLFESYPHGCVIHIPRTSKTAKKIALCLGGEDKKFNKGIERLVVIGIFNTSHTLGEDYYIINPTLFFKGSEAAHRESIRKWIRLGLHKYGGFNQFNTQPPEWEANIKLPPTFSRRKEIRQNNSNYKNASI